jgi:hypothetical protein
MITRPRWVMAGDDNGPDGVTLWASNTLTQAELCEEIDFGDVWQHLDREIYHRRRSFLLTAAMIDLVMIRADDWPQAFRRLFDAWSPGDAAKELTS